MTIPILLGAIAGDMAGSCYEWHNIKFKPDQSKILPPDSRFTDDTVMTCAVAEGLCKGLAQLPDRWMDDPQADTILTTAVRDAMLRLGRKYPHAGYGHSFRQWLNADDPQPYTVGATVRRCEHPV